MIERCPACAARTPGEAVCRRCGTELHSLLRVIRACQQLERQTVLALLRGEIDQASRHLEQAMSLKRNRLQESLARFLAWRESRHESGMPDECSGM